MQSSRTTGPKTLSLGVDHFLGLFFFAVRLRLILVFFVFRFLGM
jgi:hypothetical protein